MNLLLKLSLSQSILITIFTSSIKCLWGGVLVITFPQAFLEVLHHSLHHVGRNCCHFFPDVLFQIHRCPWFLFVHPALEISSEDEVLRLWTLVPMNTEVPTKYPLSQDTIVVFENRLHSKSPMLYRPVLHGNWNALSLARRALKNKFPTPTVPPTAVLQNCQVFLPDPVYIYIYIHIYIYIYIYTHTHTHIHTYSAVFLLYACISLRQFLREGVKHSLKQPEQLLACTTNCNTILQITSAFVGIIPITNF